MKKILLLVLCFAMIFAFAFAGGSKEAEKIKIVLIHGYADFYQPMMDQFKTENPDVDLVWVPKGGGVVAVDALIAAKEKPNLFFSTIGELGKFLRPDFAIEITKDLVPSLDKFKQDELDIYKREGKLYALPVNSTYEPLNVNLTLAEKVGFRVPDRDYMTIDEFLQFGKLIKDKAPGCYLTAIWAGNQGSQYINWSWFASFGAQMFKPNDYSKMTINSPQGIQAMNFIKLLLDKGYIPPEAGVLDDDEAIAMWASGKIGAMWARAGGWIGMINSAVQQGMLDKPFEHMFMTWPSATGKNTPILYMVTAGMVIDSGDEKVNRLAARLLELMTGKEAQEKTIGIGSGFGTRTDVIEPPNSGVEAPSFDPGFKHYRRIADLFTRSGMYDIGVSLPYSFRQEWLDVFQPFLAGSMTAEDALATLEKKANELLAGE